MQSFYPAARTVSRALLDLYRMGIDKYSNEISSAVSALLMRRWFVMVRSCIDSTYFYTRENGRRHIVFLLAPAHSSVVGLEGNLLRTHVFAFSSSLFWTYSSVVTCRSALRHGPCNCNMCHSEHAMRRQCAYPSGCLLKVPKRT